jgi:hypothetical protein
VKKVASFALIAVLLMNTMGYYAIFLGMQYKNGVAMTERFDAEQYDESQTITIEIPITVPYMTDDADFRRVDGIFEYKGEFYRLIKQKYAKETLTVICIRDTENQRINEAMSDYVMSFTDTGDDQDAKVTISFIKDYIPQTFSILRSSIGWQKDVANPMSSNNLIPTFTVSVIHPPERA